jgi:hypothetical protein
LLSAAEASLFTLYFPAGLSKTYRVLANSLKPTQNPAGLYANFTFHFSLFTFFTLFTLFTSPPG